MTLPPKDAWVDVATGVKFMEQEFNENEDERSQGGGGGDNDKKAPKTKILNKVFLFQSEEKNGGELIDAFIKKAFDWYTAQIAATVDNSRYMYMLSNEQPKEEGSDEGTKQYKRYKLSDRKTFDSLFFPEKENLLHLFDNFLGKKGTYAIPGYPDKLGLLLFGPPGSGRS